MPNYFELFNALRAPDWRRHRVLRLLGLARDNENGQRVLPESEDERVVVAALARARESAVNRISRSQDDKYTAGYYIFRDSWNSLATDTQRFSLYAGHKDLFYANTLQYQPDSEWRWIIEACLLAGMTNREIGKQIGTTAGCIRWYEALFYNVRDRIDSEIWVMKTIMGTLEQRHRTDNDGHVSDFQWQMLMKLFAYYGGPEVLKVMLSGLQKGTRPKTARDIAMWFDTGLRSNLQRQGLVASRVISINKYNATKLIELALQLQALTDSSNAGGPKDELDQNINQVLTEMKWAVGTEAAKKLPAKQKKFLHTAAELRADEAFELQRTGVIPNENELSGAALRMHAAQEQS